MKYSIIIPTLNEEILLPRLLESLGSNQLKKKYEYEIIVSDGGSIDRTIDISRMKADKIITPVDGEVRTISAGRANGALAAEGEFLIFINADVIIDLESVLDECESVFENSNCIAMTCPVKPIMEGANNKDRIWASILNIYFSAINSIGIGMARGEFQVIRKSDYLLSGGYNIFMSAGEDFELFTRIRKLGRVFFNPRLVVYESTRRYHKWGYSKILLLWFLNSTSSWLFKRSFSKEWEQIR